MLTGVPDIDRLIGNLLYGDDLTAYSLINVQGLVVLNQPFWTRRVEQLVPVSLTHNSKLTLVNDGSRVYNICKMLSPIKIGFYAIHHAEDCLLERVIATLDPSKQSFKLLNNQMRAHIQYIKKFANIRQLAHNGNNSLILSIYLYLAIALCNFNAVKLIYKKVVPHLSARAIDCFQRYLLETNSLTEAYYRFFMNAWPLIGDDCASITQDGLVKLLIETTKEELDPRIVGYLVNRPFDWNRHPQVIDLVICSDRIDLLDCIFFSYASRRADSPTRRPTIADLCSRHLEKSLIRTYRPRMFRYLIDHGAQATTVKLSSALNAKSLDVYRLLCARGMEIKKDDSDCLARVAEYGWWDIFRSLLEHGVDHLPVLQTLIFEICRNGREEELRMLIKRVGQDIRLNNDSALRIATFNNHHRLIGLLLEIGADARVAMANARLNGDKKTIAMIEKAILDQAVQRMVNKSSNQLPLQQ